MNNFKFICSTILFAFKQTISKCLVPRKVFLIKSHYHKACFNRNVTSCYKRLTLREIFCGIFCKILRVMNQLLMEKRKKENKGNERSCVKKRGKVN